MAGIDMKTSNRHGKSPYSGKSGNKIHQNEFMATEFSCRHLLVSPPQAAAQPQQKLWLWHKAACPKANPLMMINAPSKASINQSITHLPQPSQIPHNLNSQPSKPSLPQPTPPKDNRPASHYYRAVPVLPAWDASSRQLPPTTASSHYAPPDTAALQWLPSPSSSRSCSSSRPWASTPATLASPPA